MQMTQSTEAQEVVAWRRARLVDAGFSRRAAALVADDPRYDLHSLIELTERGCPPALALRILAPLDGDADGPPA